MTQCSARIVFTSIMVVVALGVTGGCMQVYEQAAKTAFEDRSNDDHLLDATIDTHITTALADKDKSLLLDVKTDVWEQRVMLTGTLDDPKVKADMIQLVQQADTRVKKIYNEIQMVSTEEKEQHREAAEYKKDASKKMEGAGQFVNDYWIETKINAQ